MWFELRGNPYIYISEESMAIPDLDTLAEHLEDKLVPVCLANGPVAAFIDAAPILEGPRRQKEKGHIIRVLKTGCWAARV
jgi:hypothetical protein